MTITQSQAKARPADVNEGASDLPLSLIAAIAANGVIGQQNRIPWHISTDLKRFRALTLGKPVLMGRKTYEAIGRPLPDRISVVVSRRPDLDLAAGVWLAHDIAAGLALAREAARELNARSIALIGGAELFAALIDRVARLHLTFVEMEPPGDTFFPPIDWSQWQEVWREAHRAGKGDEAGDEAAFTFVDFVRRTPIEQAAHQDGPP
jgi:dihydrofolate reductase